MEGLRTLLHCSPCFPCCPCCLSDYCYAVHVQRVRRHPRDGFKRHILIIHNWLHSLPDHLARAHFHLFPRSRACYIRGDQLDFLLSSFRIVCHEHYITLLYVVLHICSYYRAKCCLFFWSLCRQHWPHLYSDFGGYKSAPCPGRVLHLR